MSKAWVVSAHMPKVEKNPKSPKQEAKKETRKEEEERKVIKPLNTEGFSTPEQLLEHMEQIRDEKKNGWCLPDTKVFEMFQKQLIICHILKILRLILNSIDKIILLSLVNQQSEKDDYWRRNYSLSFNKRIFRVSC